MIKKSIQDKQNKISFYKTLISVFVVIVFGLFITKIIFSNLLATSGQRLAAANQKITLLEEENDRLENEASKLNSLSFIEIFAKKEGFIKASNVEVLIPSGPIANK